MCCWRVQQNKKLVARVGPESTAARLALDALADSPPLLDRDVAKPPSAKGASTAKADPVPAAQPEAEAFRRGLGAAAGAPKMRPGAPTRHGLGTTVCMVSQIRAAIGALCTQKQPWDK